MVSRPPGDDGKPSIDETVHALERQALEQLRLAAYGDVPHTVLNPELLTHIDPRVLAQLFLAALGRDDHPDSQSNPIYALYQVAVDYRCSADAYRALADMAEASKDSGAD